MATSDTLPDPIIPTLLARNRRWVSDMKKKHGDDFFKRSAESQQPKVLWIGWCAHPTRDRFKDELVKSTHLYPNSADSRVPESVILDCLPGEIFAHRNIAK
jgi:carbonic anhydrase